MHKKILAVLAAAFAAIMLGLTATPANASTVYTDGALTTVVINNAADWKFSVVWETNYTAVAPANTEPAGLFLCQQSGAVKKYARSAQVTWKNGRTGGIVKRWTYNFGQGPTSSCNTLNQFADPRGQFPDINIADFPTLDIKFYGAVDLGGSLVGSVTGYEY